MKTCKVTIDRDRTDCFPSQNQQAPESRPSSALLRGVKITEYKENRINPEPVTIDEQEFDKEEEDVLTPIRLREITGCENLSQVKTLVLKVDTEEKSLGNFGTHTPNLEHLKLSDSRVPVIRDLGSNLRNLRVLWMCHCQVRDLDGLPMLVSLSELYLSYNNITDISSCSMLENLTVLDLEGNDIDDIGQLSFLTFCLKLSSLTLEGNPICISPSPDFSEVIYNYRDAVTEVIQNLKVLDGEPTSKYLQETTKVKRKQTQAGIETETSVEKPSVLHLQEDWNMLYNLLEDDTLAQPDDGGVTNRGNLNNSRPITSRPLTTQSSIHRPGSALKTKGFLTSREIPWMPNLNPYKCSIAREGEECVSGKELGTNTNPIPSDQSGRSLVKTGSSDESGIFSASSSEFSPASSSVPAIFCGNLAKVLRLRKFAGVNNLTDQKVITDSTSNENQTSTLQHPSEFVKSRTVQIPFDVVADKKKVDDCDEESGRGGGIGDDIKSIREEFERSIRMIKARKAPQVLKITHEDVDDDDDEADDTTDDEVVPCGDDGDKLVAKETNRSCTSDMDRKRKSLEKFADYFAGQKLSTKPIDLNSQHFKKNSSDRDLKDFYDADFSCGNLDEPDGDDVRCHYDAVVRNRNQFLRQSKSLDKEGMKNVLATMSDQRTSHASVYVKNSSAMSSSSALRKKSFEDSPSDEKKKEKHRLKPILQLVSSPQDRLTTAASQLQRPKPSAALPSSTKTSVLSQRVVQPPSSMSPLHHKTIMKAASQFLRTGQIVDTN